MDWEKVLQFVVTVAIMAIATFVVPWLKEKLGAEKLEKLKYWYTVAVQAAEQLFPAAKSGEQKKAYAEAYLADKGIKVDDAMLEAVVKELT